MTKNSLIFLRDILTGRRFLSSWEHVNWAWSVVASFEWNPYQDTTWLRSLHFRSPFFFFFFDIIIITSAVPFSPSPFHKHSITIPFNRNGQEWRAPDDNNVNRIPSARKSIETPRISFRKEHTFLRYVSRTLQSTPRSLLKDAILALDNILVYHTIYNETQDSIY